VTRLLILMSVGAGVASWRILQDIEDARWHAGAAHVCGQFAQDRRHRVEGRVCMIEIAGVWHVPPGVVAR